jgi:hypothetical protein
LIRRYLVSYAQNATPAHKGFLESVRHFPGDFVVIQGRYKNPTSPHENAEAEDDAWYDPALVPFLTESRLQLCSNLCLYGDLKVQPTAVRPLTGFEVFCGKNSAIIGHPKRALDVVPSATRMPRILVTTGACTVENYSDSKAGAKGRAHHALGGLVVEIEEDGTYHLRHVSAGPKGDFVDLDRHYTPDGIFRARRAESLTLGDLHVGREDPGVTAATEEQIAVLRPKHLVLHDVLDFESRNPHDKGLAARFEKRRRSVKEEVQAAVAEVNRLARLGDHHVHVVRSNHDQMFDRWLNTADPREDSENVRYWCEVWGRLFAARDLLGYFPDAFATEAEFFGKEKNVSFLRLNESLVLKDVNHGFHGHIGLGGSRGTPAAYVKMGCKTSTGHTHAPGITDGNTRGGVGGSLDHGYNNLPGTWLNANIHLDSRGKRQLLLTIRDRWRAVRGSRTKNRKAA